MAAKKTSSKGKTTSATKKSARDARRPLNAGEATQDAAIEDGVAPKPDVISDSSGQVESERVVE